MEWFKKLVDEQDLTATDITHLDYVCRSWVSFSTFIGQADRAKVLKMLRYLTVKRPYSATYGKRAVQRFNSLNRARWRDLTNGI